MVLVRNSPQVRTIPSARHIQHAQDRIRNAFAQLWDTIQPDVDGPDNDTFDGAFQRERVLAITHIEEACMRAIRATTRRSDNYEPAVEATTANTAPAPSIDAALQRVADTPAVD